MKNTLPLAALALCSLAGCRNESSETPAVDSTSTATDGATTGGMDGTMQAMSAMAALEPRSGSSAAGSVTFTQENGAVRVQATFSGLTPGEHGFHVHQVGDCSAPDASSAGDHFNPDAHPHGRQGDAATSRHAGDFGNVTAGADGSATVDLTDNVIAFTGANSIDGKAVIVHANPDDYSQPSGNAGGRVACGVVMMTGMNGGATPGDVMPTDSLARM